MENFTTLHNASDADICAYFDTLPNLTVMELARRTGKTVQEVKRILIPKNSRGES